MTHVLTRQRENIRHRKLRTIALGVAALFALSCTAKAGTTSAFRYCEGVGTDDALRPIPRSLVAEARRLFGLHSMSEEAIARGTYFRCFNHDTLLCTTGANLPCGKADTRRVLPGADAWCAAHPDASFIPLYVTGHATIYRWQCREGKALAGGAIFSVDPRGFIAHFWKLATP